MEFNPNVSNNDKMWEWAEDDYSLLANSELDVSHYLLDDVNQNDYSFLCMLEEHTPIKDCSSIGCDKMSIEDSTSKVVKETGESSHLKRRRMLQFPFESHELPTAADQNNYFLKSKVMEESVVEVGPAENMDWNSQWNSGSSGDRCSFGKEGFNLLAHESMETCFDANGTYHSPDEMNNNVPCDGQDDISEFGNIPPPDTETGVVQTALRPSPCKIFRGRKSLISSPMKLTTSVVYPFALIKPCGVQGDVTLKDINQRIHATPQSKSKNKKDEISPVIYPTSAFSGKPVVAKTKIRTEGGRGSITIMRTKG